MVHQLRNRPLVVLALAMIVGLSIREYPLNGLLLLLGLPVLDSNRNWIALGLGAIVGIVLSPAVPKSGIESTTYAQGTAEIMSVPRITPNGESAEIELNGFRLTAFFPGRSDLSLGDRLQLTGLAQPLREGTETINLNRRIVGRFKPIHFEVVSPGPSWMRTALNIRRVFVGFTSRTLQPAQAAMVDALCFNVSGGLDDSTMENLRETGVIHIISASGFHVIVIAVALNWLLGLLQIPFGWRVGVVAFVLTFYLAAAGFEPAIFRAVLMSIVFALANQFRREPDILSALAIAAILYLVAVPTGIFEMGFQISFIVVAAIGLFNHFDMTREGDWLSKIAKKLDGAVVTSGLAFLASIPIVFFYFDLVSIVSIPANLMVGMAVAMDVVASLALFGLSFLTPHFAGSAMSWIVGSLTHYIQAVIGAMPKVILQGGSFSGYWLLIVYGLLLGLVREHVRAA
jgi:ComEC/Rec2-related protein